MEADRLYLEGQFAVAEKLYRVKAPFAKQRLGSSQNQFLTLPSYPQQVRCTGVKQKPVEHLRYRVLVPLRLLVEQYPVVPGHLRLAQALQA